MTVKKIIAAFFSIGVLIVCVSIVFAAPEHFGLCSSTDINCIYKYADYDFITAPVIIFSSALSGLLLVSFFVRKEAFYAWIKFAIPWTIFSGLLVAQIPQYGGGGLDVGIGPSRGGIIIFLAGVLLVISLIIIFVNGRKLKEGNQ